MSVLQIGIIGVIGTLLAIQFKGGKTEYGIYMGVGVSILLFSCITYIAEFSSSICKDAGYQTIAVQIEIFCKLTILALGMPVLLALLETIQEFLA